MIWYAVYNTGQGDRKLLERELQQIAERAAGTVFKLTYERMRRYEGSWHMELAELFPDALLLESPEDVTEELSDRCTAYAPFSTEEERTLRELFGEQHCLRMSRGIIRSGAACVTDGPLRGRESMIAKIDRHKRIATLKLGEDGTLSRIPVGLEITKKTE